MDANLKSEPGIAGSTDYCYSWLPALEPAFAHDLKQKLKAGPRAADDRNDDLRVLLLDSRQGPDPQTSVEEIDDHQWVLRPLSQGRVPLMSYLADHEPGWLGRAAVAMKEDTETDFEAWLKHRGAVDKETAGEGR